MLRTALNEQKEAFQEDCLSFYCQDDIALGPQ